MRWVITSTILFFGLFSSAYEPNRLEGDPAFQNLIRSALSEEPTNNSAFLRYSITIVDISSNSPSDAPWASLNGGNQMCAASSLKAPSLWAVFDNIYQGRLRLDFSNSETEIRDVKSGNHESEANRTVALKDIELAVRLSNNKAAYNMITSLGDTPQLALENLNDFFLKKGLRSETSGLFLGSAYNKAGPRQQVPPEFSVDQQTTTQTMTTKMLAKFYTLLGQCRLFPKSGGGYDTNLCHNFLEILRFRDPAKEKASVNSSRRLLANLILTKYPSNRARLYRKTGSLPPELPTCFVDSGIIDRGQAGKYVIVLACQDEVGKKDRCNPAWIERVSQKIDDLFDRLPKNPRTRIKFLGKP